MILTAGMSLQIVLTAAKTTNDMDIHVTYQDWNPQGVPTVPAMQRSRSNGTTDAPILDAPVENARREVLKVSIVNADTASKTLIVKTDDGTERFVHKMTLAADENGWYERGSGWSPP